MAIAEKRACSFDGFPEARGGQGLRILLFGIDAECASSLVQLLCANGHQVWIAPQQNTTLEEGWRDGFDVVVQDLDTAATASNSLSAELEMSSPWKKRPLMIVVAASDPNRKNEDMLKFSGDLHLLKPFNPWLLLRLFSRFQALLSE